MKEIFLEKFEYYIKEIHPSDFFNSEIDIIKNLKKKFKELKFISKGDKLIIEGQSDEIIKVCVILDNLIYFIKKNDYKEILKLKDDGYKIYAVGTTVLRTLETVINTKNYKGSTDLYIKPGYQFKLVDYLITNFHAPNSSLLSIVLSIYGKEWKELYMYAQTNKLKFLSFGDAVLFKIQ